MNFKIDSIKRPFHETYGHIFIKICLKSTETH
jgi:hypothetical protein